MARVRGKDTTPEMVVRRLVHRMGYRYRLHRKDLPGKPDLVLPRHKLVIFVHGCFWHRHAGCSRATMPQTRTGFWEAKFSATVERDRAQAAELTAVGWQVLVIWECDLRDQDRLEKSIMQALDAKHRNSIHG
jgi:DNA mismatch endonuclease, patch repair protein